MQEIDGATGNVFGHALDLVVERPAVPAIEIAFVLDEQIGSNRVQVAWKDARAQIGKQPAAHFAINLSVGPIPFSRRLCRAGIHKHPGMQGEDRVGKRQPFQRGSRFCVWTGFHEQIVNVDVDAEL
jgi:hypothetical protein